MPLERLALSRSGLDRSAELRAEPGLLVRLAADPATRLLVVHEGKVPVIDGQDGRHGLALMSTAAADRADLLAVSRCTLFVGTDREEAAYLAIRLDDAPETPAGVRWAGLREVGTLLDDTGVGALTTAVALLGWHAKHERCSVCGSPTDVVQAGWVRQCPVCGAEHYPRTDPAVIMAVVDADDRLLLGRQASWPERRFSTLAGFVEPGESLEDAVRREVHEESSVVVGEVTYLGSQPWPFPSSLMLGFHGRATSTAITVDGVELAQAQWWSRDELTADVSSGRLRLPPGLSIARRLIEHWFGGPVEDADETWR